MENFKINDRVIVIGKNTRGKIAFIGETHFTDGEIYGIILDEAKSKYSGTIDDVCYFECPRNYATFARACQLKKYVPCSLEDYVTPMYPNYLKDSSCKLGLKTIQHRESKTELDGSSISEKKSEKSQTLDDSGTLKVSEDGRLQQNNHEGEGKTIQKVTGIKKTTPGHFEGKMPNIGDALDELNDLKQKLRDRDEKFETVQNYLRKLKTYIKWNNSIKMTNDNGDRNTETFLKLLSEKVLKNIENIVNQISNKDILISTDSTSADSEETNFLRMYVEILEKRNEVLADSLTRVRNILECSWNRSRCTKACKCIETPEGKVEKNCPHCSSKSATFTNIIGRETRSFLKSDVLKKVNSLEHSNKKFEEFAGSEKVKMYLDSLASQSRVPNYTESKINSNLNKDVETPNKEAQPKYISENDGCPPLTKSCTEPEVALKYKKFSAHDRFPKNKMRSFLSHSQTGLLDERKENKPSASEVTDPTAQVKEFISEFRSKYSDANKLAESIYPGPSSSTIHPNKSSGKNYRGRSSSMIPPNKSVSKDDSKMEDEKSYCLEKSSSHSTIKKTMKQSLNSRKPKFGKNIKRSKSECTRSSIKRQPFK